MIIVVIAKLGAIALYALITDTSQGVFNSIAQVVLDLAVDGVVELFQTLAEGFHAATATGVFIKAVGAVINRE